VFQVKSQHFFGEDTDMHVVNTSAQLNEPCLYFVWRGSDAMPQLKLTPKAK
jgi:hypothetical protein